MRNEMRTALVKNAEPAVQQPGSRTHDSGGARTTRLLSPRFIRGRGASVGLTDAQRRCVRAVTERLKLGVYALHRDCCPCGDDAGMVIAHVDRYGLPLDTVLCATCGTLRIDPYLSADHLFDFYAAFYQEMYARVNDPDVYFRRQQAYGQRVLRFAQKKMLPVGASVVEVGCGAGGALAVFQAAGYRVRGCDYSEPLLQQGRQRGIDNLYLGDIDVLAGKLTGPYQADLILFHHVFEHMSSPIGILETAKRLLSDRGLILVAVPDVTGIEQFPDPAGNLRLFLHIAHKYNFTVRGLAALARRVELHASVADVEVSRQAPEMWVAFSRDTSPEIRIAEPEPAQGEALFRLLRGIEFRFIRNELLGRLGRPFGVSWQPQRTQMAASRREASPLRRDGIRHVGGQLEAAFGTRVKKRDLRGLALRVKWLLFRLLEGVSEVWVFLKSKGTIKHLTIPASGPAQSLWIFASTIGELSAIEPLLRRMQQRLPHLSLTLLSDHDFYEDSFLAKYPAARFRVVDHRTSRVRSLMDEAPPALVVLAEIPCLLSEAPCRLPFALAFEAKRRGARLCLVNGWLYRQQPSSRMDAIEKRLFERRYLQLFDVMTVQNAAIRQVLIELGGDERRVFVTGNVKFDALAGPPLAPRNTKSAVLLNSIARSGRPVLTAGNVTNVSEQELVLDAFRMVCNLASNPLLVLAPRYPNNVERMDVLEKLLSARGYRFAFKSRLRADRLDDTLQCLILDTLGELREFYAASTISYVGLNKNVLEPLAFGKRVLVTPGWDPIRPGYSVSRRLVDEGFITEVQQGDLGRAFLEHLEGSTVTGAPDFRESDEYRKLVGATDQCMARLEPVLTSARL